MQPVDTQASELLQDLDRRQESVLEELEALNARVEKVLESYLGSRPVQNSATGAGQGAAGASEAA